jgi:hypothetical protein
MESSMSLAPYLGKGAFDPTAIAAMETAYNDVLEKLRLARRDDPVTQMVARKVIEIAGTGERDPARIRDLALLTFEEQEQRSA